MVTKELTKEFLFSLPIPTEWRKGQFIFNMMYRLFPDIVRETQNEIDCYYNDNNIDGFLEACIKRIYAQ